MADETTSILIDSEVANGSAFNSTSSTTASRPQVRNRPPTRQTSTPLPARLAPYSSRHPPLAAAPARPPVRAALHGPILFDSDERFGAVSNRKHEPSEEESKPLLSCHALVGVRVVESGTSAEAHPGPLCTVTLTETNSDENRSHGYMIDTITLTPSSATDLPPTQAQPLHSTRSPARLPHFSTNLKVDGVPHARFAVGDYGTDGDHGRDSGDWANQPAPMNR